MNYLALWDHVLDHLHANGVNLDEWRSRTVHDLTDRDLLEEYAWVVISCGLTPSVPFKVWPALTEAFGNWEPIRIDTRQSRVAALQVIKSPRKIDAIVQMAESLQREPGQMARLGAMPLRQALKWLQTLPWVGPNNVYHMARNMGFDCVVRTGPVPRLAAYLGVEPDELCAKIASLVNERVRTVDLALWKWSFDVGDEEARRWAGLFKMVR